MLSFSRRIAALLVLAAVPFSLTGCMNSKPPKSEVQQGIVKILQKKFPLQSQDKKELVDKFSTCVTDKIYDKVSAATLDKFAEGEDKTKSSDMPIVQEALNSCLKEVSE